MISPAKLAKPGKPQPANAAIISAAPMNGSSPEQAAQLVHLQRAGLLIEIAAQAEGQRGEKAVRDHDQHRAGDADEVQAGDAEEDKSPCAPRWNCR